MHNDYATHWRQVCARTGAELPKHKRQPHPSGRTGSRPRAQSNSEAHKNGTATHSKLHVRINARNHVFSCTPTPRVTIASAGEMVEKENLSSPLRTTACGRKWPIAKLADYDAVSVILGAIAAVLSFKLCHFRLNTQFQITDF